MPIEIIMSLASSALACFGMFVAFLGGILDDSRKKSTRSQTKTMAKYKDIDIASFDRGGAHRNGQSVFIYIKDVDSARRVIAFGDNLVRLEAGHQCDEGSNDSLYRQINLKSANCVTAPSLHSSEAITMLSNQEIRHARRLFGSKRLRARVGS